MPRILSTDVRRLCSDEAYNHLVEAMNKKTDQVKVKVEYLHEVCQCHANSGLRPPWTILYGSSAIVDREKLFNFVVDHGEVCGKKVDNDWVSSRLKREERIAARKLAISRRP